jgi:hypothetical protein
MLLADLPNPAQRPMRYLYGRVAQVVLDLGSRFRPQVESGDANDVPR